MKPKTATEIIEALDDFHERMATSKSSADEVFNELGCIIAWARGEYPEYPHGVPPAPVRGR